MEGRGEERGHHSTEPLMLQQEPTLQSLPRPPTPTDRGSPLDPLSVVVCRVGPPVCLGLHITQDHVLHWNGQPWDLHADRQQTMRLGCHQCFPLRYAQAVSTSAFYDRVLTCVQSTCVQILLQYMPRTESGRGEETKMGTLALRLDFPLGVGAQLPLM